MHQIELPGLNAHPVPCGAFRAPEMLSRHRKVIVPATTMEEPPEARSLKYG